MKFFVYSLKSSEDDKIFYIGKGSGTRHLKHISIAKGSDKNKMKNPKLYNKIKSIYEKGFEVISEFLFLSNNEDECFDIEKTFIEEIGIENLCNLREGGKGGKSICRHEMTDETRQKIGLAVRERIRLLKEAGLWFVTDETKQKLSESLKKFYQHNDGYWKGKTLPQETKEKMSLAKKGKPRKPRDPETKRRIAETMKRKSQDKTESRL